MAARVFPLLLAIVLLSGCFVREAWQDETPAPAGPVVQKISHARAVEGVQHFAAGMTVDCRPGEDGRLWCTLTAAGRAHDVRIWHEADFYAISSRADVIVMHDRFTERQDRLLVFRFSPAEVRMKYVGHGAETEGYLFRQFRDIKMTATELSAAEELQGANRPGMGPTSRRKRVPLE